MTRRDMGWLWAIAGAAIGIAIWVGMATAQTGLSVPGDITVTDDVTIGDDLAVGDDSSVSGTSTMNKHSSSFLPQRILVWMSEAEYGGKAYGDTICGMPKRLFFTAPCNGLIYDVYFTVDGIGSGWDSLKVDVFAGVGQDTSVFTTVPMLIPADGAKATTQTSGRAAVMSSTMRVVDAGERVEISATTHGTCTDGPTGLFVGGWFQPDYGN